MHNSQLQNTKHGVHACELFTARLCGVEDEREREPDVGCLLNVCFLVLVAQWYGLHAPHAASAHRASK
eukprot:1682644-Rhodomonas_salina.2